MTTNGTTLELMPQVGGEGGGEEDYNLSPTILGEDGQDGDTYTLNPDELAAFTAIAQGCGELALLGGDDPKDGGSSSDN